MMRRRRSLELTQFHKMSWGPWKQMDRGDRMLYCAMLLRCLCGDCQHHQLVRPNFCQKGNICYSYRWDVVSNMVLAISYSVFHFQLVQEFIQVSNIIVMCITVLTMSSNQFVSLLLLLKC